MQIQSSKAYGKNIPKLALSCENDSENERLSGPTLISLEFNHRLIHRCSMASTAIESLTFGGSEGRRGGVFFFDIDSLHCK